MSVNQEAQSMIVGLPQHGSQATGEVKEHCPCASCSGMKIPRCQSTPMNQDCLAYEMPVMAQSTPNITLEATEGNGSALSESTGEKIDDRLTPPRPKSSTGQKQGTLMSWLKTSKSVGDLKTDTAKDIGTDTKRDLGTDTKKDLGTGTEAHSTTETTPASAQGFHVPGASSCFTFRAPSPLDGLLSDGEQPALKQDARPGFNFPKTASSPSSSTATLFEGAHPLLTSSGTPQHHGPTAGASVNDFVSKPAAAPSLFHGREAAHPINLSDRTRPSDPSPLHGGQVAPPSGIFDWKPIPDPSRLSNSAWSGPAPSGLLPEGKPADRSFRPEKPVRSFKNDGTQSINATRVEKQGPQTPSPRQFLTPTSAEPFRYSSAPSTASSTPQSRRRLGPPYDDEYSSDSRVSRSASASPTAPNTPVPNAGGQTPGSEESDDFFRSSPPFGEECGYEDDSLALIRSPSPGSLEVIWKWNMTRDREKMPQGFFWIVQHLWRDLSQREIRDGYIYAFKVKDPQGMGYVKIGYAANITQRMKSHARCYGEYELIYPPPSEKFVRVNHAYRVEKLIHSELKGQSISLERYPRYRQAGHKCHSEWFDVEERHAIAVIRKWSEWMSSSPYEERLIEEKPSSAKAKSPNRETLEATATMKWRLKTLERNTLMKICWPLDPLAPTGDADDIGTSLRLINIS